MSLFKITYVVGDSQRARLVECEAESDGEATEWFEDFAQRFDDGADIIGVVEVECE